MDTAPPAIRGMSPRPFALHMLLATGALMSSRAGLRPWNNESPDSNRAPGLWPGLPESLAAELARADPQAFERALDREVAASFGRLADGIAAYRAHPYRRPEEAARAVWRCGAATLFDHSQSDTGPAVLFVPSLINRGWVLDLIPGQGMLSWMAGRDIRPYRLEWGPPGESEKGFDIGGYVAQRLEPALDELIRRTGGPVVLVGYCMGGLLSLAAALKRPDAVRALALLATPWDFDAEPPGWGQAFARLYRSSRPLLDPIGYVPIDAIQALFTLYDPILGLRKFQNFATMDPHSPAARAFVALEDWLNDGVPVSLPVADESLGGWYLENRPGRGLWRPGGVLADPARLDMPVLVVVPGNDRIVPPASAAALIPLLRRPERLDVALGHIGMVVSRQAEAALWNPLRDWILNVQAST